MKTKTVSALIMMVMISIGAWAQAKINVKVKNIKEQKGTIRVGLFTSEENFLKKAVEGKVVKVSGKEMNVTFENLAPGSYAVSVIHDENENGELDKNAIGIPSEGFGFGNNAMGMFGPPSFDDAKVVVDKNDVKQEIELRYY